MKYIDNSTRSYVLVIVYQNRKNKYLTSQSQKIFSTCEQFESGETNVVLFFFSVRIEIAAIVFKEELHL